MIKESPATTLAPLGRADGSASHSSCGYSVIGAVNGPIEVQRRDELPDEAAVDVIIRPAAGVGGIRERHLESIIQSTLRHVILISAHPRTLIQVTLHIVNGQGDESASAGLPQSTSNLQILPALLQTALLALLTSSIPLSMTLTSALIAVNTKGKPISEPSPNQLKNASSLHFLAFSSLGDLLVVESEGDFSIDIWEEVYAMAEQVCRGTEKEKAQDNDENEDVDMELKDLPSKEDTLRTMIQRQAAKEQRWKQSLD